MSGKSETSLHVALGPSRALAWLLAAAHGGAVVIALILPVPWAARLALAAAAAIGFYVALRQQALRVSPRAVVAIDIDGEGEFGLRFADAHEWRGCELADSWVHPKLVLLSLRGEGRRHARVAIAADALPAEAFRRLRVWLRLRTVAG